MSFLFSFLSSLTVGIFFYPVLIKVLSKYNISESPGGRKIHKVETPSMGGIGFIFATILSLAIWGPLFPIPDLRYLLGGIAIMFFIGLRDDMVELRASQKLLGQLVASVLVVVASDIRITSLNGFIGVHELNYAVSCSFSIFVLLALTNAFNLIDGLDGLAGTIAIIVFSLLGVWFMAHGLESYAVLCFILLGSIVAFMIFNWHPAKIFMGDTGSLTLGFTMGALILAFMEYNTALPTGNPWKVEPVFSTGIALMIFPLYDMARVFTRRISQGKGPMTPDKSHVHHFLMRMGMRHNQVALFLGGLQLCFIALVFMMKDSSDHLVLPIVALIALGLGYRLDKITVKYVRKKVSLQPNVLEMRALTSSQKKKIKLDTESLKESNLNMN